MPHFTRLPDQFPGAIACSPPIWFQATGPNLIWSEIPFLLLLQFSESEQVFVVYTHFFTPPLFQWPAFLYTQVFLAFANVLLILRSIASHYASMSILDA